MPQLTLPTTLGAVRQAINANGLPKNNFAAPADA